MALRLVLSDDDESALCDRAAFEGMTLEELAARAIRNYVGREAHREEVTAIGVRVTAVHADALDRLGQ